LNRTSLGQIARGPSARRSGIRNLVKQCCAIALLLCFARSHLSAQPGPYKIIEQWPLSGASGWRSMVEDQASHVLYVVRNDRITLLDTSKGTMIGEILGLSDGRSVALDPDGKLGYVSDGVTGELHIFDRVTRKLMSTIVIGGIPDEVIFEPVTNRIFVFNTRTLSASVIDAESRQLIGSIALSGRPASATADGKGSVFVNLNDTNQISRLDAAGLKVRSTWSISPCKGPTGIAIDDEQLFSVCENRLLVISDATTMKVASNAAIGEGARGVAFDRTNKLVFTSNGEGSLTVLEHPGPASLSVVQILKTQPGSRLLALDSVSGHLYLGAAHFGQQPGPTSEELEFRPTISPGSVEILVVGR
jgi:DNA-binding beta-propeller fold protein YncE